MDEEKIVEVVQAAVKAAVQKQEAARAKQERQKVLYNTRMLMEGYREMQEHLKIAISEVEELEEDEYSILRGENSHLESVRRSKLQTAMMIANIDRAMEQLKKELTEKGQKYKYEAFKMHYIDGFTLEDIAEKLNCGKNTPSRWIKEMIRRMSVKIFGIQGIEKW